ncbi:MAG: hypothetical protein ABJ358_00510, partial [Rhizobiaceae bacterium]
MSAPPKVTLIGFGEAGAAFARGWQGTGVVLKAFDIKTQSDASRTGMLARYQQYGVEGCDLLSEAVAD